MATIASPSVALAPYERVHRFIERHEAEYVEEVRRYLRLPGFSDTGEGIRESAEATLSYLKRIAADARLVETPGNPVVYGTLRSKRPDAKTLIVYGLYDQTPLIRDEWDVDPLAAEIVEAERIGLDPELGKVICNRAALYDTRLLLVIILVAVNQPFTIWLLRNFFAAIPPELEEAAMVDGCTRLQAYRLVILPLLKPGLITAGIFTMLLAYQEYLIPLVLTQTRAITVPVFITQFSTENVQDWPVIAAGSVSLALPIVAIVLLAQRYLIAGLTAGAVKG